MEETGEPSALELSLVVINTKQLFKRFVRLSSYPIHITGHMESKLHGDTDKAVFYLFFCCEQRMKSVNMCSSSSKRGNAERQVLLGR